ncbi:MAG TPA: hypothetical protein PKG95_12860, partial [Anaerolineaceae bacterium]|nr:hypothetical protein [Anaerolineaceae bacterium]
PGTWVDGGDGLNLDYNALTVPAGYPVTGNPLHDFLSTKDPNWHLRQITIDTQYIYLPIVLR